MPLRSALILLSLVLFSACSAANDAVPNDAIPSALRTPEIEALLASPEGRQYYVDAKRFLLEDQGRYKRDPALAEYYRHLHAKDYAAAFAAITVEAQKGHAHAQAELASMYLMGQGMPVDVDKGIHWLDKSVAQGHLPAMAMLGGLHANPQFGHVDLDKSYRLLQACARKLRPTCISSFASLQLIEGAAFFDPVKAMAWFDIGADQGAPGAVANRAPCSPSSRRKR